MFCNKCGNKLAENQKFCNKCGNQVASLSNNNVNSSDNTINNKSKYHSILTNVKNNRKMIFTGIGIGIGIFLIVFGFITSNFYRRYYFSLKKDPSSEINQKKGDSPKRKKYQTVIVYDNTYSGVKISDDSDAFSLIEKDSVSQKKNCPSEIKKIEDEIINKYGITAVNLCEMDVEFAKELGNVFKKIYNEYPSVRGYITNLTLVNASMDNNYIAAFMPVFNFATADSSSTYPWVIKTQVLLNTSYFLNKERLEASVNDGSSSGHFPKNSTIYSPVAHELGHYLSFLAMMKYYKLDSILLVDSKNITSFYSLYDDFGKGNYSLSMIKESFGKYKKDTNDDISLDEWRGTISNYALAKDNSGEYIYDETIAEAFHDVYLNGDNASIASKYIVATLKEKLES